MDNFSPGQKLSRLPGHANLDRRMRYEVAAALFARKPVLVRYTGNPEELELWPDAIIQGIGSGRAFLACTDLRKQKCRNLAIDAIEAIRTKNEPAIALDRWLLTISREPENYCLHDNQLAPRDNPVN